MNSYYFSHDYSTRSDFKIKKLIRVYGMEGYGVFWAIIEMLYQNANALPLDCEGIAFELRVNQEVVSGIINDFELFAIEGDTFKSLSVEKRLKEVMEKSEKARKSALARWGESKEDANAMRTHSDSNAINKINKINKDTIYNEDLNSERNANVMRTHNPKNPVGFEDENHRFREREGIPNEDENAENYEPENEDETKLPKENPDYHLKSLEKEETDISPAAAKKGKKFDFRKALLNLGANPIHVDEWISIRSAKKAINSEYAFNIFLREFEKSGLPIDEVLKLCNRKQWRGFEARYLENVNNNYSYNTKKEPPAYVPSKSEVRFGVD